MRNKYISPKIKVDNILLEENLAAGSVLIKTENEAGAILIEDWTDGSDLESPEENSRW